MLRKETLAIIQRKVKFAQEQRRQMATEGMSPQSMTMLIFDSQDDYKKFYSPEERPEADHQNFKEFAEAMQKALAEVGIPSQLIVAHWGDYVKWLGGRKHTMYTRSEYAAYMGAAKEYGAENLRGPSYT